jgi:hypothetical protein
MPRPQRVYFADVVTPLSLTDHGYAVMADHHLALQQHTDQGMVFRVEADSSGQAAEQVIDLIGRDASIAALYPADRVVAEGQQLAFVPGEPDPRLLPPLLASHLPPEPTWLPPGFAEQSDDEGDWDQDWGPGWQ